MENIINYELDLCSTEVFDLYLNNVCVDKYHKHLIYKNFAKARCINTISFSELKDHVECSYRHKLKYVDKINMFEENVNTNFGTALHEACETYLKTREMKYELALDYIVQA
jgi:hypothetical protein